MEMESIGQVAAHIDFIKLKNCLISCIKADNAKNIVFVVTKRQPLYNSGAITFYPLFLVCIQLFMDSRSIE